LGVITVLREYLRQRDSWEDICSRCSMCCHERDVAPDGQVYVLWSEPCPYLDQESGLCTVYDRRFEICERCRKV